MHQPDPAGVLAHLAGLARPGAVVAFAEISWSPAGRRCRRGRSSRRMVGWIDAALSRAGVHTRMGIGPAHRRLRARRPAGAGRAARAPDDVGVDLAYIRWAVETLRTLLPGPGAPGRDDAGRGGHRHPRPSAWRRRPRRPAGRPCPACSGPPGRACPAEGLRPLGHRGELPRRPEGSGARRRDGSRSVNACGRRAVGAQVGEALLGVGRPSGSRRRAPTRGPSRARQGARTTRGAGAGRRRGPRRRRRRAAPRPTPRPTC